MMMMMMMMRNTHTLHYKHYKYKYKFNATWTQHLIYTTKRLQVLHKQIKNYLKI